MNEFIIKKSWFPWWFGHIAQLIISETSDDTYNYISAQQLLLLSYIMFFVLNQSSLFIFQGKEALIKVPNINSYSHVLYFLFLTKMNSAVCFIYLLQLHKLSYYILHDLLDSAAPY